MADCKRKTANLFSDKLIGMTWWDGVITADERFTLHIAEVKPNTTYTASGNNSVDNIMVTYYSVYPAEGQSSVESVRYVYPTNPTRSVATFTTPDDSRIKYAAVRFGSDATDVMFNLGSTAFPYEPYGWVHSLRKLSTDTDTITTLPALLYPTGTTATVGLKGHAVQSGTPTPDSPIMPQGTGERTGNLYFKKLTGANISDNGTITTLAGFDLYIAEVEQGVQYSGTGYIYAFFENEPAMGSGSFNGSRVVDSFQNIVSPINGFVAVRHTNTAQNAMCNTGNTTLPYEPYGYKLDISSGDTTTPIYLGESESTRRVKKLVLDGTETVAGSAVTGGWIVVQLSDSINNTVGVQTAYGSHFVAKNNGAMSSLSQNEMCISTQYNNRINFVTTFATAEDFKAYLAAQYAAGTPVTVWYVLAEPETAVVNEPLMKIGDYADEVSGISIPVTAGGDTISVDTTVQPSEITVNYEGWHSVQSVHIYPDSSWMLTSWE